MPGKARRRDSGWSSEAHNIVDRLFVYGTLRAGQTARSMIADYVVKAVPASMDGRIYALPEGYPGYVPCTQRTVIGEVLHLADLTSSLPLLDAYEGDEFERTLGTATLAHGEAQHVWVYQLVNPESCQEGILVPNGDWGTYRVATTTGSR